MIVLVARRRFDAEVDGEPVRLFAGLSRVLAGHPLSESHALAFEPALSFSGWPTGSLAVAATRRLGAHEFAGVVTLAQSLGPPRTVTFEGRADIVHDVYRGDLYSPDSPLVARFPEFFEPGPPAHG